MTLFNLNYVLKALSPDTVTLRVGTSTYELGVAGVVVDTDAIQS